MTVTTDERRSAEATIRHIELIARKRARLEHAQAAAEEQLGRAAARLTAGGDFDAVESLYARLRAAGLPGFSKRWTLAGAPSASQITAFQRASETEWFGEEPYQGGARPPSGVSVVYVLYDAELNPCYVGSTGHLAARLTQHRREKTFKFWRAIRCEDRDDAYRLENEWLAAYMPQLNKRRYA